MNVKKFNITAVLVILLLTRPVLGSPAQEILREGNKLYAGGNFNEAINKYDESLVESPEALEPKFNKANSYYRLDDLEKAIDLYREVAADSKDMKLVSKAKYNLGNCSFQQGLKQRDSNLQKAIDDLKAAIGDWRGVLDIEPENEKAAKNIEVARLIIKDIIDQMNKQQQQQDPNQPQNQEQQQQQQQQQDQQGQDPNQSDQQDPNQPQESEEQQQQEQPEEKAAAPDTTAQEILDKEQQEKKQRQKLQRAGYQKVEKDW
ncbi:MAG: tetratricopeptide repeat protein [Planctomycetota bacterium]